MNTPVRDELQLEANLQSTQDQTPPEDAQLVEMGRVSDTRGGFLGPKPDNGGGFQNFESPALPDIQADDAPQRLYVVDVIAKLVVDERRVVVEQVDDIERHLHAARR